MVQILLGAWEGLGPQNWLNSVYTSQIALMLARQCYHILTVLICSLYALDEIRSFHI